MRKKPKSWSTVWIGNVLFFIEKYFNVDWPDRLIYHTMLKCVANMIKSLVQTYEASAMYDKHSGIPMRNLRQDQLLMRRLIRIAVLGVMLISRSIAQSAPAGTTMEVEKCFREFAGLSDDQIRDIRSGRAVAKVLESPTADEVFVFGAVYINSTPERYLTLAADINELRKPPSFIALKKFSDPPQIDDLHEFVLDEKDR